MHISGMPTVYENIIIIALAFLLSDRNRDSKNVKFFSDVKIKVPLKTLICRTKKTRVASTTADKHTQTHALITLSHTLHSINIEVPLTRNSKTFPGTTTSVSQSFTRSQIKSFLYER